MKMGQKSSNLTQNCKLWNRSKAGQWKR